MFTWTCDAPGSLIGCGVDVERIDRFARVASAPDSWPMVFSAAEHKHAGLHPEPARALCAAFCAKEALFKSLRKPFDWSGAECRFEDEERFVDLELSGDLCRNCGVAWARARFSIPAPGQILCVVWAFRGEALPTPCPDLSRGSEHNPAGRVKTAATARRPPEEGLKTRGMRVVEGAALSAPGER